METKPASSSLAPLQFLIGQWTARKEAQRDDCAWVAVEECTIELNERLPALQAAWTALEQVAKMCGTDADRWAAKYQQLEEENRVLRAQLTERYVQLSKEVEAHEVTKGQLVRANLEIDFLYEEKAGEDI